MVIIQEETTKNPISLIGKEAGVCWNGDIEDSNKNYKRGLDCLASGHGRTFEYPQIYMIIDQYSARVIREFYTHIGGAPSRMQASTRYIDYEDKSFSYVVPPSIISSDEALNTYIDTVQSIQDNLKILADMGMPREDIAMLLPMCMTTKIVVRTNLRNLIDMSHQRMCTRAYWEYRQLFNDICKSLSNYSEEWKYLVKNYFKPKCEVFGYCPEKNGCGRKDKKC